MALVADRRSGDVIVSSQGPPPLRLPLNRPAPSVRTHLTCVGKACSTSAGTLASPSSHLSREASCDSTTALTRAAAPVSLGGRGAQPAVPYSGSSPEGDPAMRGLTSPTRLDQSYGRLVPSAARPMEYQSSFDPESGSPPPPSERSVHGLMGRCRVWWESVWDEWRLITVVALLFTLCMLVGDISLNVHWKLVQDYAPPLTYAAIRESMDAHPSFLNFYTSPSDASVLLLEFPSSYLKSAESQPPVIFSAQFAQGLYDDVHSGVLLYSPAESTEHTVFTFNLTADGTGVDVIRQQFGLRTSDPQHKTSLDLGARASRVATLPLVAASGRGPKASVVVDAGDMMLNGFYITELGEPLAAPRLRLSACRSYPLNWDVTVEYMILDDGKSTEEEEARPNPKQAAKAKGSAQATEVVLSFSVAQLPTEPIIGRAADERVGYFSLTYTDVGDHRSNSNFTTAYKHTSDLFDTSMTVINRRRVSSTSPITFYVDPTVPEKWRPAFAAGVEAWKPAFEAAGIGAQSIRVVLPGDADWPEDYDAGDLRYSSISWIPDVDDTFALSPSVVDPRSGEILGGDIIFTHGWIKYWTSYLQRYDSTSLTQLIQSSTSIDKSAAVGKRSHRALQADDHSHHHHHEHEHTHDHDHAEDGVLGSMARGAARARGTSKSIRHHRRGKCQMDRAKYDTSHYLARMALDVNAGSLTLDDLLFAGIKETIAHEVGHALGLRHNFRASTGVTWEQTQDPVYTKQHGLSLSIMDYLPLNIVSTRDGLATVAVDYFSPVIGAYDIMAIRYGYTVVPGEVSGVPTAAITAIADVNLPFATDEDGASSTGPDPFVSTFDFTSEPQRYYNDRLDLVAKLRPALLEKTVLAGDPYTLYMKAEESLVNAAVMAGLYMCKYIGGFSVERFRRGATADKTGPVTPISGDQQAEALKGILRVLTDDADDPLFPQPEAMSYLVGPSGECSGLYQTCLGRGPDDILKHVDDGRIKILNAIVEEARLERVRTAEWALKGSNQTALSTVSLFQQVTNAVWGQTLAASTRVAESRNWTVQLAWLDALLKVASRGASGKLSWDIAAAAAGEVGRIQQSIETEMTTATVTDARYPLFKRVMVQLQQSHFVVSASS